MFIYNLTNQTTEGLRLRRETEQECTNLFTMGIIYNFTKLNS